MQASLQMALTASEQFGISMLELGRKHVLQHLDEANWRLDSLRVVVVTHQ